MSFTIFNKKFQKRSAWFLLIVFSAEILFPPTLLALTSGPSQPEVQSFEPITTNQMVDLFSGDFNYNIPLMTVPGPNGGYPINLAYHSGISMEQEASWVGLGWNISPGSITRQMRGLPDDFSGAKIHKTQYTKPNRTYSIGAGINGAELQMVGIDGDIGLGTQVTYNNYKGVGIGLNFSVSTTMAQMGSSSLTGSASLDYDPNSGLGFTPSLSLNMYNRLQNFSVSRSKTYHAIDGVQSTSLNVNFTPTKHQIRVAEPQKLGNEKSIKYGSPVFNPKKTSTPNSNVTSYGAGVTFSPSSSFAPSTEFPTANKGYTVSFKPGAATGFLWAKGKLKGSYSESKLIDNDRKFSGYGFMYFQNSDEKSLMDFNRDNNGIYTSNTRFLPFPTATNDVFQVKGQGIGGVFKGFRGERALVHDAQYNRSYSEGGSLDGEFAGGVNFHGGIDAYVTHSRTKDGPKEGTQYYQATAKSNAAPFYEPVYFKASGELVADGVGYEAHGRTPRMQSMSFRSNRELFLSPAWHYDQRLDTQTQYDAFIATDEDANLADQIGEITVLNPDGNRYVYGLPAYNNFQEDYTSAIDPTVDIVTLGGVEMAKLSVNHLKKDNKIGIDHFYSYNRTPKYAHSFLVTAVYSQDYVDLTNNGPTEDDLGYYVKFDYTKHSSDFKWRAPLVYASYNKGAEGLPTDDKASFTYGTKELYYLTSIETKTHKAEFTLDDRTDGHEAYGKFATEANAYGSQMMQKLTRIDLFSKKDQSVNPVPIKTVHFKYAQQDGGYPLCSGVLNNSSGTGKLTLEKVYFTYGNSAKGALSPYHFTYSAENHDYKLSAMDRWGNYKPYMTDGTSNKKNPYVKQDQTLADTNAKSWNLEKIDLPSGGTIVVDYESDDYQYVQNKKAQQMMRITAIDYPNGIVSFICDATNSSEVYKYIEGIDDVYFKLFSELKDYPTGHASSGTCYDYVEGYATIDHNYSIPAPSGGIGKFKVNMVQLGGNTVTPFQRAAVSAIKLNRPDILTSPPMVDDGEFNLGEALAFSASFFGQQLEALIMGFENYAVSQGWGDSINTVGANNPSFVRLNNTSGAKLGGGHRVASIKLYDDWNDMTTSSYEVETYYGQQYTYKLADGTSSGVAENEPLIGAEESALRKPLRNNADKYILLHPENYTDQPVAQNVMPAAGVGYSRVLVESIHNDNRKGGSGIDVTEFYTSKDFPFRFQASTMAKDEEGPRTIQIPAIGAYTEDTKDLSQDFTVYTNNMHGKVKHNLKYKTGQELVNSSGASNFVLPEPLERTTYLYNTENQFSPAVPNALDPELPVYTAQGSGEPRNFGQRVEQVLDSRENEIITETFGGQANLDVGFPFPAVSGWPRYDRTERRYKTEVKADLVSVNGVLMKTINEKDGSKVLSENHVFDAKTGKTLLSSVSNEFTDPVYEWYFPAHWNYPGMGPAFENIHAELKMIEAPDFSLNESSSGKLILNNLTDVNQIFTLGDEVTVNDQGGNWYLFWVTNIVENTGVYTVTMQNADGNTLNIVGQDNKLDFKITRSGKRNLQDVMSGYIKYLDETPNIPVVRNINYLNEFGGYNGETGYSYPANVSTEASGASTNQDRINFANCNLTPTLGADDISLYQGMSFIRIPNNKCGEDPDDSQFHTVYGFVNVPGGYCAGVNAQSFIDQTFADNSIVLYDNLPAQPSNWNNFLPFGLGNDVCHAEIILPQDFADDFANAGGAVSPIYGLTANYKFTVLANNKIQLDVKDPLASGTVHATYICEWSDPSGCFDQCMAPLDAWAVEFEDSWSYPYADVGDVVGETGSIDGTGVNPYRYGQSGIWRQLKKNLYQTDRKQTEWGSAGEFLTDIRKDGTYESFNMFDWETPSNNTNWTWTSEVTKYSPYGFELEEKDALERYSSALYGYDNSLATAVVQNASYWEVAYESFDEHEAGTAYEPGAGHLRLEPIQYSASNYVYHAGGHTGDNAMKGTAKMIGIPIVEDISLATEFSFEAGKQYLVSFWANSITSFSLGHDNNGVMGTVLTGNNLHEDVIVEGWKKHEYVFTAPAIGSECMFEIQVPGGAPIYDDFRIQPFHSSMSTYVYDPINLRLTGTMDAQNMATFYNYDEEGVLVQVKKETTEGIQTIKTTRNNTFIQ